MFSENVRLIRVILTLFYVVAHDPVLCLYVTSESGFEVHHLITFSVRNVSSVIICSSVIFYVVLHRFMSSKLLETFEYFIVVNLFHLRLYIASDLPHLLSFLINLTNYRSYRHFSMIDFLTHLLDFQQFCTYYIR